MNQDDPLERRLVMLRSATNGVCPRPGFADQVMSAIAAEGVWKALNRVGGRFVAPVAVAVVVAVAWAASSPNVALMTYVATTSPLDLEGGSW